MNLLAKDERYSIGLITNYFSTALKNNPLVFCNSFRILQTLKHKIVSRENS